MSNRVRPHPQTSLMSPVVYLTYLSSALIKVYNAYRLVHTTRLIWGSITLDQTWTPFGGRLIRTSTYNLVYVVGWWRLWELDTRRHTKKTWWDYVKDYMKNFSLSLKDAQNGDQSSSSRWPTPSRALPYWRLVAKYPYLLPSSMPYGSQSSEAEHSHQLFSARWFAVIQWVSSSLLVVLVQRRWHAGQWGPVETEKNGKLANWGTPGKCLYHYVPLTRDLCHITVLIDWLVDWRSLKWCVYL